MNILRRGQCALEESLGGLRTEKKQVCWRSFTWARSETRFKQEGQAPSYGLRERKKIE